MLRALKLQPMASTRGYFLSSANAKPGSLKGRTPADSVKLTSV